MKRDQPTTPDEWLDEIRQAIADASKTKPFGLLVGQRTTDANLFHLAPLVCLKFRGLDHRDEDLRKKVTEGALANYVANSDPDGIDHGLEKRPLMAFAMCYIAAHSVGSPTAGRRWDCQNDKRQFSISTRRWRVKGKAVKGIRGKFSTDGNRWG